jgi:hypothetical protein
MDKRKQTKQWSNENRQYNGQKKTDNAMVKRKQTIQWSKENRQKDNGQHNNTQKTLRLSNMKPTLKQG